MILIMKRNKMGVRGAVWINASPKRCLVYQKAPFIKLSTLEILQHKFNMIITNLAHKFMNKLN